MNILEDLKRLRKENIPYTKLALKEYIVDVMENFFFSMFEYKNFPASMPKEYAEKYFLYYGTCAADKIPEKYNTGLYKGDAVFLKADPSDEPDVYGVGSKVILTSMNGYNEIKDFDKVAFGWNNSAHTNLRQFISLVSDALANALTSLRSGVSYSKNHPIYKARDDKEAAALNEYWKKVKDSDGDDDLAIASKNILDELEGVTAGAAQNVINLSDPINSDKLQYVDRVVDSMIRRYFSLYGQSVQGGDKLAQESVDEVNGYTSTSFILPNDMLYQRKLWLDKMKALQLVPEDAEIDFSTAWKVEEIKYKKEAEAEEIDEQATDGQQPDNSQATDGQQPENEQKGEPENE